MSDDYEEADIRAGLREGGRILQAFIVMRPTKPSDGAVDAEYVCYIRTNWRRGYRILQVARHKYDKIYMGSGLGRLVWLLHRGFDYNGPLIIYHAGCEHLQRFAGLRPIDSGHSPTEENGPPRAAPDKPPWEWPVRDPSPPEDDSDLEAE